MTRHDDTVALRHMLDHAEETILIAQGRSRNVMILTGIDC